MLGAEGSDLPRDIICVELVLSDRKLKASRKGSKRRNYGRVGWDLPQRLFQQFLGRDSDRSVTALRVEGWGLRVEG